MEDKLKYLRKFKEDYLQTGFRLIKELIGDQTVQFNTENLDECPFCIGDNYVGIVDGIIKSIKIEDDKIMITYIDNNDDTKQQYTEELQYLVNYDLVDIYSCIEQKLKNG